MAELQKLKASLNFTCTHYSHKCTYIPSSIDVFHKQGNKVDDAFVTAYLTKLTSNANNYSSCVKTHVTWVNSIISIFKYLDPLPIHMTMLISSNTNNNNSSTIDKNNIDLWKSIIDKVKEIPISVFEAGIKAKNFDILLIIVDYTKTTSKCIEDLCNYSATSHKIIGNIIDRIFLQKIQITTTALNNALKANSVDLAISFLQKGVHPDSKSLVNACGTKNDKIIGMILLCKLTPTNECFKALLPENSYYGSINANQTVYMIDMLVQHGYVITYDDVIYALERKQHINNVKRFNIKFDNKFIEKCSHIGYYPYSEKDIGVKPTIECLRIECGKQSNIKTIKTLINSGLKPDIECLRNACKSRSGIVNIRLLIEKHGLKVDVQCLKNLALTIGNKSLSYLLENVDFQQASNKDKSDTQKVVFDDHEDISDEPVEEEEEEEKEEVKEKEEVQGDFIDKAEPKPKPLKLEVYCGNNNLRREKTHGFIIKTLQDGSQVVIGIDEDNDGEITKQLSDEQYEMIKNLGLSDNKQDEKKEQNLFNMFKVDPAPESDKKESRKKYALIPEAIALLGAKKTAKCTTVEVRSQLTKYIIDNNLINNKNKSLIKLNDELIKLLKAAKNQYIEFSDLDGLVHKCIKK